MKKILLFLLLVSSTFSQHHFPMDMEIQGSWYAIPTRSEEFLVFTQEIGAIHFDCINHRVYSKWRDGDLVSLYYIQGKTIGFIIPYKDTFVPRFFRVEFTKETLFLHSLNGDVYFFTRLPKIYVPGIERNYISVPI